MAREFSAVNVAIWSDPDFLALPPAAQHLYLLLWTSPALTYCGAHDWRPGRLAARSSGFTADHITTVGECLSARHFLVIDHETEEVVIRSWARFDGLMKQPRMAVSYANAYSSVASQVLRSVLAHETRKIRDELPQLPCWGDKRVAQILEHPAVSAKDLPTPRDPFGDGFTPGLALGLPQTLPKVSPSVCTPSTPAPATTPYSSTPERAPDKSGRRAHRLPDGFEPNDTNRRVAEEQGVDLARVLPQFLDHHAAKGSTLVDWHKALNTWIRREKPEPAQAPVRHLPHAHELELPPDGLSASEYAAWERKQRERRRA